MIPVLNAGFVEVISAINDSGKIKSIEKDKNTLIREDLIGEMGVLSLKIRLPFFLKANLAKYMDSAIDVPDSSIEFYIPTIDHLVSGSLQDKQERLTKIKQILESSLDTIKSSSYDQDTMLEISCLTPSSIYCTVIVTASLNNWLKYVQQKPINVPHKAYLLKIKEILSSLWIHLV